MPPPLDKDSAREASIYLARIQQACREYVTQTDAERKMTFASIRIAADSISALADDVYLPEDATEVAKQVNEIHASVDDLADRFGSEEEGACRVCGKQLQQASLGAGVKLRYCTNCPSDILEAVRNISDLTGAEAL